MLPMLKLGNVYESLRISLISLNNHLNNLDTGGPVPLSPGLRPPWKPGQSGNHRPARPTQGL